MIVRFAEDVKSLGEHLNSKRKQTKSSPADKPLTNQQVQAEIKRAQDKLRQRLDSEELASM